MKYQTKKGENDIFIELHNWGSEQRKAKAKVTFSQKDPLAAS